MAKAFKRGDLVDKALGFVGAQFETAAEGLGTCAAVHAGEITRLGCLPDHNEWTLIEVKSRFHAALLPASYLGGKTARPVTGCM